MEVLREVDFYKKYLDLKKEKGFGWKTYGGLLNMTDATIRMAFKKKSLKDYEIEIIENYFDSGSSPKKPILSNSMISLDKGIFQRDDEVSLLAGFLFKYRNEFEEGSVMNAFFNKLRLEGENDFIKKLLDSVKNMNDEKAKVLKDAVSSLKLPSKD